MALGVIPKSPHVEPIEGGGRLFEGGLAAEPSDEKIHQLTVPLPARAALEGGDGPGGGEGGAVGSQGGHGVVGVGDGDDARTQGDLVAGESVGVAVAVHALVVVADDGE